MSLNQLTSRKNLAMLMLCIGLVQIAGYYLAGMLASPDGSMAVPQPDTLLYCQAARRIAEGCPFSFSEGSAACTGTTSVLYPFVLAIPYLLGAKGDALFTAGFILNALFYIMFLLGWAKALKIWLEEPLAPFTAALLIALSGQIAFCAMAQSDIGCWLALSGWLAAGLASRNRWLYGSLLSLGPWIRPEGMICVLAFGIILVALALSSHTHLRFNTPHRLTQPFLIFFVGIASCMGVFALNYYLTGQAQFASVANKGYFKTVPFMTAIDQTAIDGLRMIKDYLFGLAASSPRDSFLIPFLSAVFMWIGIFKYRWPHSPMGLAVFITASAGGFLSVAQSGWQGTNFDRYLVWTIPILLIFLAEGISSVAEHLKSKGSPLFLPAAVCLLFSAGVSLVSMCRFYRCSASTDHVRLFAREIDKAIPAASSIGSFGEAGIAYELRARRFRHLCGIYSPEFLVKSQAASIEILKNNPQCRFDYWFLTPDQIISSFKGRFDTCYGENILTGPGGMEIRKAAWSAFDHARIPKTPLLSGKSPVCKIDVGHEADEERCSYVVLDRYGRQPTSPFIIVDELNGKLAVDAARLLVGGDAMTVPLEPGKDVVVVMRTYPRHTDVRTDSLRAASSTYAFANPLTLNVSVDDQPLQSVSIPYATNGFSDVSFTIPGTSINKKPSNIAFLGDHIAAGYWFFQ